MNPARVGLFLGMGFGSWNLLWTHLNPLADDTIGALLAFYGPMFAAWAVTAYVTTKRTGALWPGIKAGALVALVTFCVLDVLVIIRANLFLDELSGRADWRTLMARFPGSGYGSLRTYINMHYLSQAPFKIFVATLIGVVMGVAGGTIAAARRLPQTR
jgi:hypothetical protein